MKLAPFIFGGARPDEASALVGGPAVLQEMKGLGLLEPVTQRNRLTLYDRVELRSAWERWKEMQRQGRSK